jgi:hypothetical protein
MKLYDLTGKVIFNLEKKLLGNDFTGNEINWRLKIALDGKLNANFVENDIIITLR